MPVRISYNGFCALGGLTNPRLFTRPIYNGRHFMYTAYFVM